MKYSEAKMGRVFVIRMEDGDVLNDTLEAFAQERGIERALAFYVGGVADGSRIVVGPDESGPGDTTDLEPGTGESEAGGVIPLLHTLIGSQEAFCVGTLFPNEDGAPVLHMHTASGREGDATVGCTRAGVQTWLVGEVVMIELVGSQAMRKLDDYSGFTLLDV